MSDQNCCQTLSKISQLVAGTKSVKLIVLLLSLIFLTITSCNQPQSQSDTANEPVNDPVNQVTVERSDRLAAIAKRGKIICGVNDRLPGFSYKESDGSYSGISVDLCRALAAALFDDPTKVEYRHLEQSERFRAVATGQVDLLSRDTTWNLSRDTAGGLDFPPTNFYDGQGLLVGKDSGITQLDDLNGKSICFPAQTTTEENLAEQMRKYNIGYIPMPFENPEQLYRAYAAQECDVATSDRSQLVARRSQLDKPDAHLVLDIVISKEPLGPVIANGEPAWLDVVSWVSYATIKAEELKISSQNIDRFKNSQNPEIRRFLGLEGKIGSNLDLPEDFAYRVVKHVGNYGEIYARNIGQPFGLARGDNALWQDGGLMYSPPFR